MGVPPLTKMGAPSLAPPSVEITFLYTMYGFFHPVPNRQSTNETHVYISNRPNTNYINFDRPDRLSTNYTNVHATLTKVGAPPLTHQSGGSPTY